MNALAYLSVRTSWETTLIVVLLALFGLYLFYLQYSRQPKKGVLFLESLKLIVLFALLFLLFQPEWIVQQKRAEQPSVTILWDDSQSMTTQDVELDASHLVGRNDIVQNILQSPAWADLKSKVDLRLVPFSSPEKNPDGQLSPLAGTDIQAALMRSLEENKALKALVLISDGDQTLEGTPMAAAQQYRKEGIPIFTLPIGSEKSLPDISIESVRAPAYGVIGENVHVPVLIKSSMGYELTTTLTLASSSGKSESKEIKLPPYGEVEQSILWKIDQEGADNLTLSIPLAVNERADKNNQKSFAITGKKESIRVLIIESEPRWEYRFIRNALMRDPGVQVDVLLTQSLLAEKAQGSGYLDSFPEKMEEISQYDVVFLGDVGLGEKGINAHQAELLKGLVEKQAAGLIFLPGYRGHQMSLLETPLEELMPVILNREPKSGHLLSTPSPLVLTPEGRTSLLTLLTNRDEDNAELWKRFPGFFWCAPVERAKAGAQTLATHSTMRNRFGRLPLLVAKSFGAGKVLFMGTDSAWRWRRGVEDKYHYRFWGQVARWMSYQRNMAAGDRLRIYPNPERPRLGDSVLLTATLAEETGAPMLKGDISVEITAPDQKTIWTQELEEASSSWGVYTTTLKLNQPGEWKIKAQSRQLTTPPVELSLFTQGEDIEKVGRFARRDVMREIAQITQGRMVEASEIDELTQDLQLLPQPAPRETRYFLWNHWLTGLLLLLLLTLYWIGRKWNGSF